MLFLLQHAPSSGLISQKLLSQFSLDLEIRIDGGGSVVVLYSDGRVYLDRLGIDQRLAQHIHKGNEDGLLISSVAPCSNLWALIMDSCTGITSQVYQLSPSFLNKVLNVLGEGMHKRWDAGYMITLTASTSNQAAFVLSIREENLQMIHRTHFALLCILAHMSRAMAVYASQSGANIRVKLIWINARCPRQPGGTECGYYVMKFMKEIAYEGVEILDNDNVGLGIF
ncbi:putative papain-like cysteine peptidase superfamily [Helianthus annuus]|nr:putative papain-like cysteine peptidase superfamily [Helianthus annuus]